MAAKPLPSFSSPILIWLAAKPLKMAAKGDPLRAMKIKTGVVKR